MKNLEEFSQKNLGEEVVKIIEMIKSTVSQPDNDSKLQNLKCIRPRNVLHDMKNEKYSSVFSHFYRSHSSIRTLFLRMHHTDQQVTNLSMYVLLVRAKTYVKSSVRREQRFKKNSNVGFLLFYV